MPYSSGVNEQFEIVDLFTSEESDFLMGHSTPFFSNYSPPASTTRSPQFKALHGSLDFTIQFTIHRRRVPLFFVKIKTFRSLKQLSARASADKQMREGYREFASSNISTPTLYGLSAFGPQFSVYTYDPASGYLAPPEIPHDLRYLNDVAPKDRWAYNLLEEAGRRRRNTMTIDQSLIPPTSP
ncbi:hypothetical protein K443DRAFT_677585 [Laccaria amethystina LaAM-08-1]|uniref:Uncharacterized protein n=1 Tax=Laccaria amethystina LaAM-08-1 TaxID=1095629 RepID=A0A0C9XXZ7_9AGAR|nr:hypothetical protein K443DRAFT_677585 [Laccaria amethystina LaAM-08-1]